MLKKIQIFIRNYTKQIIAMSVFFIAIFSFFLLSSFALETPLKSIIITSKNTSFESKEVGSWQIKKSGKWISKGRARVVFDVDTTLMTENKSTDIIMVLDISGSMSGDKLDRVKQDSTELVDSLLSNGNNQVALIIFDTTSTIVSDFTSDKDKLISQINDLQVQGNTNYYQALVNVDNILKDYTKQDNRDAIVLFLTDGYPNVNTPNQITQYQYLKTKYPYITVNGIQYEMGNAILKPIQEVSDNQFFADMETLSNVLFDASVVPIPYEKFEIVDYIDQRYFKLDSKDDITVSEGTIKLEEENGKQKITWTIDNFKSGRNAKLTMDIDLKEEYIGQGGVYSTNESTEVFSKIEEQDEDVISVDSPRLQEGYSVIYDGNAPSGCTVSNIPNSKTYSVFNSVSIEEEKPICVGYQFKGWEIVTENVTSINDDYFVMPEKDVTIRAIWSEFTLAKSMDGVVSKVQTLYKIMQDQAVMDNVASEFVSASSGIDFASIPSNTNGKGVYTRAGTEEDEYPIHYYRGDIDNNHVKFANFCWKAVITTETGGVKLIYDGHPDDNGYCNNTGTESMIGKTSFNLDSTSPADVGYMYGTRYEYSSIDAKDLGTVIYGNDIIWDGSQYTLVDTIESNDWANDRVNLAKRYHYTCLSADNTCDSVYYIHFFGDSTVIYYLTLNQGNNIEDIKNEMFSNTTDSTIKTMLDVWYSENMIEYTKYLEDTVWCNDRKFFSGSLKGKDVDAGTDVSYFTAFGNNIYSKNPSVSCSNLNDSFTVSNEKGNGALTYPIALLTVDEFTLAGHISEYSGNSYLDIGRYYWSLSPDYFYRYSALTFRMDSVGSVGNLRVSNSSGVRPSVSLSADVMVVNGDGSSTNPYEVELVV